MLRILFFCSVLLFFGAVAADSPSSGQCVVDRTPVIVPPDPHSTGHIVTRQEYLDARRDKKDIFASLFGEQAANVARFNRLDPRLVYPGRKLRVPEMPVGETYSPLPVEYPAVSAQEQFILIVLDRQFLGLYECGKLVASYPISSGKPGFRTLRGDSRVTRKCQDCKSSIYPEPDGGAPMPWALQFRYSSYWMHGGDLPGWAASHGCVRLFVKDAEALFRRIAIGTGVKVVNSLDEL